jgi:hypothetical protein
VWASTRRAPAIHFRERQRRLQFEAARLLRLRDGDGGLEGFFGRRKIRRIALQDYAADAVELGVGPALSRLARQRQSFVDPPQGAVRVIPLRFELCEQTLEKRRIELVSRAEICRQGFAETPHPAFAIAKPGARPM